MTFMPEGKVFLETNIIVYAHDLSVFDAGLLRDILTAER